VTTKTLGSLAGLIAILVIAFLILDYGNNSSSASNKLIPDLESQMNDVSSVVIRKGNESVTVQKSSDGWVVVERSEYPANIGTLRDLLLGIADAQIIERKTSDPDKYHLIGVNDPSDEASESVEVVIAGDDFEHSVLLGTPAQSNYRFARPKDQAQSVLIDQNPDIPDGAGGWLANELVDIGAERVQQVIITHADGEKVTVEKPSPDAPNFDLIDIPDGRELSYPTVANGMAAALAELMLDDVRSAPAQPSTPVTTATIRTFDGLQIDVTEDEDGAWLSFLATAADIAETDVQDEAAQINDRVKGWQYAIPEHKASLLKRRIEELLKAEE
jgi:hypothetical protein